MVGGLLGSGHGKALDRFDCVALEAVFGAEVAGVVEVFEHVAEFDQHSFPRCRRSAGELVNEFALAGWAVAYRRFSTDYVLHEDAAKKARRGIWRGEFQMPWDWRSARRDR